MDQLSEQGMELLTQYGMRMVGALAILVIGRILVSIITGIISRLMDKSNVDTTLSKFISSLAKGALLTFVIVAALGSLGVQTASIIAVIGAAGLAVGFALQGSLSNFASGIMLIFFRPFKSGDYIQAGGTDGTVEEVSIFNTILRSGDNKKIIVPNSKITADTIINSSARKTRRVDLVFGIGYGDDLLKAKKLLEQIVTSDNRVLTDPAPMVAVAELADSSVNFTVRVWVKAGDYWSVYFSLLETVKLTFDEQEISIPFPQHDVHLHQVNAA